MSSKVLYPSLSEDGWVSGSIKVADNLLSCFLISDYSQSYIYNGFISSFPWILEETQNDISRTISLTEETLRSYFSRYFNDIVVEVSEVPNIEEPSKGQISLYINFTDTSGITYVVGKLLKIVDMKVQEIININNG